jgi:hypothetical protein
LRPVTLLSVAFFVALPQAGEGQNRTAGQKRQAYTGTYVTRQHGGAGGTLLVREPAPGKIEFDLECNNGAPSYNSGSAIFRDPLRLASEVCLGAHAARVPLRETRALPGSVRSRTVAFQPV